MRATFVFAAMAAGIFAMSAAAQAQDTQMAPDSAAQQSAQGAPSTNDSSYGGATSMSKSGSASHEAWKGTGQACTPGLSCNIYRGQ